MDRSWSSSPSMIRHPHLDQGIHFEAYDYLLSAVAGSGKASSKKKGTRGGSGQSPPPHLPISHLFLLSHFFIPLTLRYSPSHFPLPKTLPSYLYLILSPFRI